MPATDEKIPPAERLFYTFRKLTDWAGSTWRTPPGGGKPRGCSSPLGVLKTVVFLACLICLPVFLLPWILAWVVKAGGGTVRYGASVDVLSGEQARWNKGVIAAPMADSTAGSATEEIQLRDPGFQVSVLTGWAVRATTLLRDSLLSGDATVTRTFMSNGLYRVHEALLDLLSQAAVSCTGSWQVTEAAVTGVFRSPLTEQVRVRVRCAGWRQERHEPSRTTLRGGPDTGSWREDLIFARSSDAVTPPGGGLPAGHCPSCGAGLDLDTNGACRYCRGVVTAGRQDWVLVSWQREPW
jgi:hypothetical protein